MEDEDNKRSTSWKMSNKYFWVSENNWLRKSNVFRARNFFFIVVFVFVFIGNLFNKIHATWKLHFTIQRPPQIVHYSPIQFGNSVTSFHHLETFHVGKWGRSLLKWSTIAFKNLSVSNNQYNIYYIYRISLVLHEERERMRKVPWECLKSMKLW